MVPDRVAVQDPALGEIGACLERRGDPLVQGDQPLVARRQGAGGDQDAAEMCEDLARRQLVERVVGDGPFVTAYLPEQAADLRAR